MTVLVLNQEEVEQLLDMAGCIEAMTKALASLARGEVHGRSASRTSRA